MEGAYAAVVGESGLMVADNHSSTVRSSGGRAAWNCAVSVNCWNRCIFPSSTSNTWAIGAVTSTPVVPCVPSYRPNATIVSPSSMSLSSSWVNVA